MNPCALSAGFCVIAVCTTMQAMEHKTAGTSQSPEKMRVSFLVNPKNVSIQCIPSGNAEIESAHQQARHIIQQESKRDIHKADQTAWHMSRLNVRHAPSVDRFDENQLSLVSVHSRWIESIANEHNDAEAFLENIKELCEKGTSDSLIDFINNSAIEEGKVPLPNNPTRAEIDAYIPDSVKNLLKKVKPACSKSRLSSDIIRAHMPTDAQRYAKQLKQESKLAGIQKNTHVRNKPDWIIEI